MTNPNGKSLTASSVGMTITLAVSVPFTPGPGIGSGSGNCRYRCRCSGYWNLTVGRAVLVYSFTIWILGVVGACRRNRWVVRKFSYEKKKPSRWLVIVRTTIAVVRILRLGILS